MFVWAIAGAALGSIAGFIGALLVAAPRSDGTFGLREIIVAVPLLASVGLLVGAFLGRAQ